MNTLRYSVKRTVLKLLFLLFAVCPVASWAQTMPAKSSVMSYPVALKVADKSSVISNAEQLGQRGVSPELAKAAASYSASNASGAIFNRPQENCQAPLTNNVRYHAQFFSVGASGSYTISSQQSFDGFLLLYSGSFAAASPLTNCIAGNDDGTSTSNSIITINLTANVTYVLVTTSYSTGTGTFTNTISGPGSINIQGQTQPPGGQVVLTFEGLGDGEAVNNFYNGGSGGAGSVGGTNFGISFGANALAVRDQDAGGTGNFGNEPSPDTVLFFLSGSAVMNVPAGFQTGFSFYYSAINAPGEIVVYDGLNATGNVLSRITLPTTAQGVGDPTGDFSPFVPFGVTFPQTARSVDFAGTANRIGFDNITLGNSVPGGDAVISINQVTNSACPQIQLISSVIDGNGQPITGLTASSFTLIENSVQQTISVVPSATGGGASQIALIFDRSGSMGGQPIIDAKAAAVGLLQLLFTGDRAALVSFASTVTTDRPLTTDLASVSSAVNQLSASGNTALYDAVVVGSNLMTTVTGRKGLVVLSDGEDTASTATLAQAIAAARAAGVPIFAIGFGSADTAVLSSLAQQTGGIFYNGGATSANLQAILQSIGNLLANQYVIQWQSTSTIIGTRTIELIATTGTATARATATYESTICDGGGIPIIGGMSGTFYNPARNFEGVVLEVLSGSQVVMYWYTYGLDRKPLWLVGLGSVINNRIIIDNVQQFEGGIFGPGYNPSTVTALTWGRIEMSFQSCSNLSFSYQGPAGYGSGSIALTRLTTLAGCTCVL